MDFINTLYFQLLAIGHSRRAVTSLEYGIIAAVVVVVGLAGFSTVGTRVATKMTSVKAAMT